MSIMGQLAALDDYDPNAEFPATFKERFDAAPPDANAAAAARTAGPYRAVQERAGTSNLPALADELIPKEPWQIGMMAMMPGMGLVGQAVSKLPLAARVGAGALGFGLTSSDAEAGVVDKAAKAAKNAIGSLFKYPQYAEKYPDVGPAVTAIDPKSKKEYLAKQLTPEAEAFAKDRLNIQADMDANGYTPFFDPAKRFHVDPKHYPPNLDTTTIVPAKQSTIDKHMLNIGSEDARARLQAAYKFGSEMPNTTDWYALGQLEKQFIKELGAKEGREAFQNKIATSMAATTGGADPTSNWLMAMYGNYLHANKLPYPQAAYEIPSPIGGRYVTGNMAQHKKFFDAGGFSAIGEANPKRHNFAQDFTGNRNAATMDEQMVSGMTPGVNVPPAGTYGLYERVLAEEAKKAGVPPQNFQDVGWSGFKGMKDKNYKSGEPFIQTVNESIERTHRLTGMPRDEIVRRGIIKSEIPMYVGAGSLGMSAIADQSRGAFDER